MRNILTVCLLIASLSLNAQSPAAVRMFPLQDVKLLPGVFKEAQNTDLKYIMALEPDRLLSPFLREAGLTPKAAGYPNWENTGLDGHIGGHYLSALSLMYASTGDKKVLERLNYMLGQLKACQDKNGDGFLGGTPGSKALWEEIANGKIDAGAFNLNKKWVPLYNIHKTYAGLRDAYVYTGSTLAKDMFLKFCDWMLHETATLSEAQIQTMLRSEQGGLNEVFADAAAMTGNQKYLELAYKFSHKTILEPLERQEDKLDGLHANTQIPKVIGFERIAAFSGNASYHTAAKFFWETVVSNRTCVIGGNSVREHFNPANDFSTMITSEQGPETCNTYNMLRLTKMLYQAEGQEKYIEYYERALYNHILSTQHPDKGGFVYFTPMRPGHYRVYSQPQTSFWCCVGSGMENHAKYGEMIYAHTDKELFVNLFIPSRLTWKEKGITLTQQTLFPDEETTSLLIATPKPVPFTLKVRYPAWVTPGTMKVRVNGTSIPVKVSPADYVSISRTWKQGDKVTVTLPMHTTTQNLPDGSNYVAVLHGPIVLAAKTDTTEMKGLFADDSREGHIAKGRQFPLQEMPLFVTSDKNIAVHIKAVANKSLTFTAKDLIYPLKYQQLELIPFFRLHDSRYVLYWQTETPEAVQASREKLAAQEAAKQQLAAITLDVVTCGEQQPESDHFIESENSNTGINKDRHWRDAKGWFSYKMPDKNKLACTLRVTYFGSEKNRQFRILINNQSIAEVALDGSHGNEFFTVDYSIPENLVNQTNGVWTVTFAAKEGSATGSIYEVRLLKKSL